MSESDGGRSERRNQFPSKKELTSKLEEIAKVKGDILRRGRKDQTSIAEQLKEVYYDKRPASWSGESVFVDMSDMGKGPEPRSFYSCHDEAEQFWYSMCRVKQSGKTGADANRAMKFLKANMARLGMQSETEALVSRIPEPKQSAMRMLRIEASIRTWLERSTSTNAATSHRLVLRKSEDQDGTALIQWETLFTCSPFEVDQPPFLQEQLQDFLVDEFDIFPGPLHHRPDPDTRISAWLAVAARNPGTLDVMVAFHGMLPTAIPPEDLAAAHKDSIPTLEDELEWGEVVAWMSEKSLEFSIRGDPIPDLTDRGLGVERSWDLNLHGRKLQSLRGAPKVIHGALIASYNHLANLEGGPAHVDGTYMVDYNRLTSLAGAPAHVGGDFICTGNPDLPLDEIQRYAKEAAVKGTIRADAGAIDPGTGDIFTMQDMFDIVDSLSRKRNSDSSKDQQ